MNFEGTEEFLRISRDHRLATAKDAVTLTSFSSTGWVRARALAASHWTVLVISAAAKPEAASHCADFA
jgi:hypothetical protein